MSSRLAGSRVLGGGLGLNFRRSVSNLKPTGIGLNSIAEGTEFESGNSRMVWKSLSRLVKLDRSMSFFSSENSSPITFSAAAMTSGVMTLVLVWARAIGAIRNRIKARKGIERRMGVKTNKRGNGGNSKPIAGQRVF